jgi:hypothetical protein
MNDVYKVRLASAPISSCTADTLIASEIRSWGVDGDFIRIHTPSWGPGLRVPAVLLPHYSTLQAMNDGARRSTTINLNPLSVMNLGQMSKSAAFPASLIYAPMITDNGRHQQ